MSNPLAKLIGDWTVEVDAPWADPGTSASVSFSWLLGGSFVLQQSVVDHPDAPDSHCVLAPDPHKPGSYRQHYFDSRGVLRLYEMELDERTWSLLRTRPDFMPLEFGQRYTGRFSADGNRIDGAWEIAHEPGRWELDFRLSHVRR